MNDFLNFEITESVFLNPVSKKSVERYFDGLTISAYRSLPKFISFLNQLGFNPIVSFNGPTVMVGGFSMYKEDVLGALEETIHTLLNSGVFRNYISHNEFPLNIETAQSYLLYCNILLKSDRRSEDLVQLFDDKRFIFFLLACVILNIKTKKSIRNLRNRLRKVMATSEQ